jgi:hypothetical protein
MVCPLGGIGAQELLSHRHSVALDLGASNNACAKVRPQARSILELLRSAER